MTSWQSTSSPDGYYEHLTIIPSNIYVKSNLIRIQTAYHILIPSILSFPHNLISIIFIFSLPNPTNILHYHLCPSPPWHPPVPGIDYRIPTKNMKITRPAVLHSPVHNRNIIIPLEWVQSREPRPTWTPRNEPMESTFLRSSSLISLHWPFIDFSVATSSPWIE